MIRINLLPVKASRRQEAVKTELAAFGVAALLLIGGLGVLQFQVSGQVSDLEDEQRRLNTEIERLKVIVGEVDKAEKLKQDLETKLKVIRDLKKSKTGPVHMLDELAQATPDRLRITDLSESGGMITLGGSALSNEVISQFLSNLEQSAYFENVYLNEITSVDGEGQYSLKTFSVTAQSVVPGGEG